MKRFYISMVLLFALAISAIGCGNNDAAQNSDELVVYSARNERFLAPAIEKFEQASGIKVKLLTGVEITKILEEVNNPQADLYLSKDSGQMEYLRLQNALQPNTSESLKLIDEQFRADDGSWIGLTARTRILMYNKDMITVDQMPKTLWELSDPKWKGKFMITRGGNGSMIAHVAALRAVWGDDKTKEWLTKLKDNAGAITSGHTDIRKGVGAGEYAFGLVNNYYYHLQREEDTNNNVGHIYPDQGSDAMGVFLNAAGAAFIKGGKNPDNAAKFVEFLLEKEMQILLYETSKETPLRNDLEMVPHDIRVSQYKIMEMPLTKVGAAWKDAKELIEAAGLHLELK